MPKPTRKAANDPQYDERISLSLNQKENSCHSVKIPPRTSSGLASVLSVLQAAQNVVPLAIIAGDKIEGLRQWASDR
jgi:hypothetical protein